MCPLRTQVFRLCCTSSAAHNSTRATVSCSDHTVFKQSIPTAWGNKKRHRTCDWMFILQQRNEMNEPDPDSTWVLLWLFVSFIELIKRNGFLAQYLLQLVVESVIYSSPTSEMCEKYEPLLPQGHLHLQYHTNSQTDLTSFCRSTVESYSSGTWPSSGTAPTSSRSRGRAFSRRCRHKRARCGRNPSSPSGRPLHPRCRWAPVSPRLTTCWLLIFPSTRQRLRLSTQTVLVTATPSYVFII